MDDLINPAPKVYDRKETKRVAVSCPALLQAVAVQVSLSSDCLLCMSAVHFPFVIQRPEASDLAEDEREPIDALEIFEVRCRIHPAGSPLPIEGSAQVTRASPGTL